MMHFPPSNTREHFYTAAWEKPWPKVAPIMHSTFRDIDIETEHPWYGSLASLTKQFLDPAAFSQARTMNVRKYWYMAMVASAVYLAVIFFGQRWMKNRAPYVLKTPLLIWNALLMVFSIVGLVYTAPAVYWIYMANGVGYLMCRAANVTYMGSASGVWLAYFIYSKYFELLDTVFLVLKKRPVSFLHWFHHTTVLMYCWLALAYEQPSGVLFAVMNYFVHSVMYTYYFLASLGSPPRWGKLVTILQIAQMFGGIIVTLHHYHLKKYSFNCDGSYKALNAALVMYACYLVLFIKFFVERYFLGKSKEGSTDSSVEKPKAKKTQ